MSVPVPAVLIALRPTARALPVRLPLGAVLASLVAVVVLRDVPAGGLLAGGFFLAAGVAPVLDDRAHATLDPSPTPRWVRQGLRLGLVLPALGACWLLLLGVARLVAPADAGVPVAVATWHWAGMVAVVLAASCVAHPLGVPSLDGSPGVAGLLGVLLGDAIVQRWWPKLGVFDLQDPAVSTRLQVRMTVLVVAAVLVVAMSVRDPATRWRGRYADRTQGRPTPIAEPLVIDSRPGVPQRT
ncbi:MAG: hypothetical protein ACRDZW_03085 [Acidimicrobiales bacterium]